MQNNTTLDQTDDFFFPPESQSSLICKSVAVAIVAMVAIVGNFLVVHTVWTNQRMQTATNYLIVNMAIADLLYMVLVIPPTFIVIYGSYEWPFRYSGRAIYFCQVVHFGQYLLVPVSVLTLATIATDRFFAITMPMKRLFTKKVYRSLMVVIWLVAAGLAAPILYAYRIKEFSGMLYCDEDWSPAFDTTRASRVYTIFLFAVAYCVPFVVMSVMYSVICRQLWMRKIPGEQDIEKSKKALESRKKVIPETPAFDGTFRFKRRIIHEPYSMQFEQMKRSPAHQTHKALGALITCLEQAVIEA